MSNSQPWHYFPLFPVYAFTSVKKARKFVRQKTGLRFEPKGHGCFDFYRFTTNDAYSFAIILLRPHELTEQSLSQRMALLAHECVHYAQQYAEEVDTKLDDETEASIVQAVMLACIDQIGEEWFTTPLQPKPKNQKKTD